MADKGDAAHRAGLVPAPLPDQQQIPQRLRYGKGWARATDWSVPTNFTEPIHIVTPGRPGGSPKESR